MLVPSRLKNKFIFLLVAFFLSLTCRANDVSLELKAQELQDEWAETFYRLPEEEQSRRYKNLLPRIHELQAKFPKRAEPLIIEAVVLCTYAASDWGFSSLSRIGKARELLIRSIDFDPKALEATAFITLGNLYFRLPGWPISFGNNLQARTYLEAAVKLYPNALDANYFLGEFWLDQGKPELALTYLEKAEAASVRPHQKLSDAKIKEQLGNALSALRKHEPTVTSFFGGLLPEISSDEHGKDVSGTTVTAPNQPAP
jgi:tetratricopeptide (TPR) repeat protein